MNLADTLRRLTTARALILGIGLAGIYYFLVFDKGEMQSNAIASANAKIQELQRKIAEDQKKVDRAMVYKRTAAEVGSTITRLLTLIPEKFSMPDLMRIVSNEAKIAGSSLLVVAPKGTLVSPIAREFEELTVELELQGTFLQHMIFLSNLTKINQILILRKINVSNMGQSKGDDVPTLKLNAEIVAYRYRGPIKDEKPVKPGAAVGGKPK